MIFRFSACQSDGAGGLFCAVCFGVGKFSFGWCFLSKWGIMGLSQRVFGPLSKNGLQQNGNSVVVFFLPKTTERKECCCGRSFRRKDGREPVKRTGGVAGIVKCHVFPACGGRRN